jgi:hypothetical protein
MTEIILEKGHTDTGQMKYDLLVKGMPEHFLGLAADLKFKGDLIAVDFQGMVLSPTLTALPADQQPIKIVKALAEGDKVVLGLTFKAGNLPVLKDGVLASFIFNRDDLELEEIDQTVVSTYSGKRKDLSAVEWRVENVIGMFTKKQDTTLDNKSLEKSKVDRDLGESNLVKLPLEADLLAESPSASASEQLVLDKILNVPAISSQSLDFSWGWGGLLALVLGIIAWVVWRFWGSKLRYRSKSAFEAPASADFA